MGSVTIGTRPSVPATNSGSNFFSVEGLVVTRPSFARQPHWIGPICTVWFEFETKAAGGHRH